MRNLDCVTEKWASLIVPGKVIDGVEEVEQYLHIEFIDQILTLHVL